MTVPRAFEIGHMDTQMIVGKRVAIVENKQPREVFVDISSEPLYGDVQWLGGTELREAQQMGAVKPCKIRTRVSSDLTEHDQLTIDGVIVKISSISSLGPRTGLIEIQGEARP